MNASDSQEQPYGPHEKSVLITLLKFTLIAMILLPISYFFLFKKIFFGDILGYPNGAIGAAGVTVIVIHIIVGFYIWVAIQEEKEPAPIKQD